MRYLDAKGIGAYLRAIVLSPNRTEPNRFSQSSASEFAGSPPSVMPEIAKLVYKILPDAPPSPLPHALPLSALDAQDGFIHLSTAAQTPKTADLFFDQQTTLWLLKVDRLAAEREGGRFIAVDVNPGWVHLHGKDGAADKWDGARLGEGIILESIECKRTGNQTWSDAMESCAESGWLVDC